MPVSYADARNIVFLKGAVRGRSLLKEKRNNESDSNSQLRRTGGPQVPKMRRVRSHKRVKFSSAFTQRESTRSIGKFVKAI